MTKMRWPNEGGGGAHTVFLGPRKSVVRSRAKTVSVCPSCGKQIAVNQKVVALRRQPTKQYHRRCFEAKFGP